MIFVFDLDDTLYDLMGSFKRTHDELFADRTDAECKDLFAASRKYNKEAFDLWNNGLLTKEEEFNYRIEKSYAQYGLTLNKEELDEFRIRYRKYQDEIKMMDGIPEMLEAIKSSGNKIAILTNGNHNDQWKKARALSLDKIFGEENIFVSEDLPAPKPEKEAFLAVEEKLGAGDYCYTGDTYDIDIVGAKNAGWKVIWFNHRGKEIPAGAVEPDYIVSDVQDLNTIINELL